MPDSPNPIVREKNGRSIVTVSFDAAQTKTAEEQALQRMGQNMNLKGFRPGHAPADMIRERADKDELFELQIRILMQGALPSLVETHGLRPIVPPKVEAISREPVTLQVTFIEKPEVTIKGIDKLTIEKKEAKADEKDVQKVIDSVLAENRTATEVDREAKTGDRVHADFHATDEAGTEIAGLKADMYAIDLGSGGLLPGFEEQLVGLRKDGTKSFTLTLPEKFQMETLRNKPATFHVTIRKVEELSNPVFDDAFAKEKLSMESAAAFKTMVEGSIKSQEEQFERMRRERSLMDEIKNRTQVDLAPELVDEELAVIVREWSERLERQGMTIADALKKDNKTPEQVEKELRTEAENRWKLRLGMAKLIEEKNVTVTDEDMESFFAQFLQNLPPEQQADARKEWETGGALRDELRWRAMVEKVVESLLA